ncbi:MAG: HAMP domain-containing methyl-accepting chemotaxis protein [Selenomonadaceae bacterium]|nr:HAMP domain-containing methyl-accepting chemotaxis protein [Selenomonadaceae bacterium]
MRITYGVLIIVGVMLLMGACLFFANKITSAIMALDARAIELSNGNLRLPDLEISSNDELGNLAAAFNTMQKNIKGLITRITNTSEQVAASAEELTAGAHQSAEAATDVAQTVVDVATGMESQVKSVNNVKVNVDTVFEDINQMTEKAKNVTDNSVQTKKVAEHGEVLMQGAVKRMESIESTVTATADVVKKLGENSQQIGAIVETISSIADQTNLLALNAAIEAARAGEAGRGFSVVAEEVRKLAEQSQTATEEIKERITNIQQDTDAAVSAMEQGTVEVGRGTEAIREVGEQFGEILSMVGSIEEQIQDINLSVQTVSGGTTNIVSAVEEIDEVSRVTSGHTQTISAAAEEQSASSQEIASASQALATLAGELQETTRQFKV